MGALTYKSYPFELRGWEIQKKISLDPTDSFGKQIKILTNNNKIIQIEPVNKNLVFISDKTRQFYDSLITESNLKFKDYNCLDKLTESYIRILYFFNLYSFQKKHINFFCVVFENVGIDILSLLTFFEQKYFFIKLTKFEQKKITFDFENSFVSNSLSLKKINICLLVATNISFECVVLNLKLKQRNVKGNFKFFNLSSNFKNSTTFGSSLYVLKITTEGNNFICQDFFMKNSLVITNSNLFRRTDNFNILKLLSHFQKLQKFSNFNTINSSIYETGVFFFNNFLNYFNFNFEFFSVTYAINTVCFFDSFINSNYRFKHKNFFIKTLKKIKLKHLNCYQQDHNNLVLNKSKIFNLPVKNFFENGQIFINNKGDLKKTYQIFSNSKKKSHWKLTRYIFNAFKKISLISNNFLISFTKLVSFFHTKIVLHLIFIPLSSFLIKQVFNFFNNSFIFIIDLSKKTKLINSKLKYWLNNFFIGGSDGLSQNSLILNKCSENYKLQSTTFF